MKQKNKVKRLQRRIKDYEDNSAQDKSRTKPGSFKK